MGQAYGYFEQFNEDLARVYRFIDILLYWAYLRVARLLKAHVKAPANVLEIGSGTGRLANMLGRMGYRVVGVDVSLPMVKQAKRYWRIDLINSGSWRLPLINGYFDAAVAVFTVHHWGNHELSVTNVAQSLKSGGLFIIAEVDGDRLSAHGHSCTTKCLTDILTPRFSVEVKRSFPLVLAIAKRG